MGLAATLNTSLNTSLTCARSLATATGTYSTTLNERFSSASTVYTSAASVAGSKVIDLAGDLLDAIGDPMIMSTVDFVRIKNASTASAISVLGGATDIPILSSATAQITINGGHTFDFLTTLGGLAISAGSTDTITITGTSRFEIVVIGRA